jgi:hypothetical protein
MLGVEEEFIYGKPCSLIEYDINQSNHDWLQRKQQRLAPLLRPIHRNNIQNTINDP